MFALFLAAAALMFFRKLPALLTLPLMAIGIGAIEVVFGRLTWEDVSLVVIADGAVRLYEPMVISMFGGVLSLLLQKSGVAESIVRRGAELAGDNPWIVSIIMMGIVALLFTTVGGLGAVIMVGTIVLPILASIGVREMISSGILLFGICVGGLLNANNWALYKTVLHLSDETVSSYALTVFGAAALGAVTFVSVELLRSGVMRFRWKRPSANLAWVLAGTSLLVMMFLFRPSIPYGGVALRWATGLLLLFGIAKSIFDFLGRSKDSRVAHIHWYAYLAPVVPLLLILVFRIPFVTAFLAGILYGCSTTLRRGSLNMISRSVIEGSSSVISAIVLMIGIGMLISAILGPTRTGPAKNWYEVQSGSGAATAANVAAVEREWPVAVDMKPLIETVVPRSGFAYILIFTLLGPLALYRGPLNVWGLGYGIGGVLLATGVPPGAIMGILMSLGVIQGVSDPTNTQNVWIANELRIGTNDILWRTLPYAWGVALLGLAVAAINFY